MSLVPEQAATTASAEDPAFEGLRASLDSSRTVETILGMARDRYQEGVLTESQFNRIHSICRSLQEHNVEVRDHCLDLSSDDGTREDLAQATRFLMRRGKVLLAQLTAAVAPQCQ